MRLRGGFGTPCDPVYTGFIDLHANEWGSICTQAKDETDAENNLLAAVACRQLGFPHGTRVDPLTAWPPRPESAEHTYSPYDYLRDDYDNEVPVEEAQEPVELYWLSRVLCAGPEENVIDCDLGKGFQRDDCRANPHRIHVACRQFPVAEALEKVVTPGAGASPAIGYTQTVPAGKSHDVLCVRGCVRGCDHIKFLPMHDTRCELMV